MTATSSACAQPRPALAADIVASSALIQIDHSQQAFEWLIALFRAIDRLRQQGGDMASANDIARLTALGRWLACQSSDTLGDVRQGLNDCFESLSLFKEVRP